MFHAFMCKEIGVLLSRYEEAGVGMAVTVRASREFTVLPL